MQVVVEKELDHLMTEGFIETDQFADWAFPIVSDLEADGHSVKQG